MTSDAVTADERRTTTAPQIQTGQTVEEAEESVSREVRLRAEHVSVRYGTKPAIDDVSIDVHARAVTAIIGPSGCGKSTLLRVFNRMNDLITSAHTTGRVEIDGSDLLAPDIDVVQLRRYVGMVFQKPNPFPTSIYDNVAYGPRQHGTRRKSRLDEIVETTLRRAALWDEVKDRLQRPATAISGGQQQRLCIARALAVQPGVLLMDEPCSALAPAAPCRPATSRSPRASSTPMPLSTRSAMRSRRSASTRSRCSSRWPPTCACWSPSCSSRRSWSAWPTTRRASRASTRCSAKRR